VFLHFKNIAENPYLAEGLKTGKPQVKIWDDSSFKRYLNA
jgi:hypothetical protein|tara:strand:- start:65094 stop:65213 length:120 start_codon:yes stop_codon:yes gene_type:complete